MPKILTLPTKNAREVVNPTLFHSLLWPCLNEHKAQSKCVGDLTFRHSSVDMTTWLAKKVEIVLCQVLTVHG